ncbi:MAG: GntR family transcriptional regulator, partial [Oscillospiraceae bacterium]|nr:GntR family transcriptional regulator [Oscillospiraceae bacterium]
MGSKIERVVEHIAQLGSGERVSVRGLAKDLGVSEGTAYQGIKAAEAQGLVITRPKAGTTRVNIRGAAEDGNTTLAEAARSIGAAALCGAERAAAKPLGRPVVADGSE